MKKTRQTCVVVGRTPKWERAPRVLEDARRPTGKNEKQKDQPKQTEPEPERCRKEQSGCAVRDIMQEGQRFESRGTSRGSIASTTHNVCIIV